MVRGHPHPEWQPSAPRTAITSRVIISNTDSSFYTDVHSTRVTFPCNGDKREFRYGQLWQSCLVVMSCRKTSVNPANTNMPAQDVFNVSCRHAAYLSTVMFLSLLPRKADAFTRQPDRENGEEPRHSRPLPLHTWQRGCSSLT